MNVPKNVRTLCWDCGKATTGECCWSEKGVPVPGWKAVPTEKRSKGEPLQSMFVLTCPEFRRDAYFGGLKRPKDMTERDLERAGAEAMWRMAADPEELAAEDMAEDEG